MNDEPKTSSRTTGGQRAIAGFHLQMLRSVQLGLRVTAELACSGGELSRTLLTLEPEDSGDLRMDEAGVPTIEQVKMRASHRRWTSAEVGRDVLPDLLKGVDPSRRQRFRFVTDNARGLEALTAMLASRASDAPDASASGAPSLRWAGRKVDGREFAARLASTAGRDPNDHLFGKLLRELEIVMIDRCRAEAEIEAILAPALSPGQSAEAKRHELISRLLLVASEGRTLGAGELLALVGPDALLRLQHTRSLPGLLARQMRTDCVLLGYEAALQARAPAPPPPAWISVLSGESGQGKTWSLCQSALEHSGRGELAIAFPAPVDFDGFVREVNERIWLPAHEQPVPLAVIARRLAPSLRRGDGCWLTVHVDDVQSRALAEAIALTGWEALGMRIVASAQPRMAEVLARAPGAAATPVKIFTSAELRRFLLGHGRAAPLETMPDDVLELLRKPIHAAMFARLPPCPDWTGVTEYELFKEYWEFATSRARDQYDHPRDAERLARFAGTLLSPNPRYPWKTRDLDGTGLDEGAILRLEAVGLVSRPRSGELAFSSDRMLNWAVAEHIAMRAVDEDWSPERTADELAAAHPVHTDAFVPPKTRLGYVLLDAVWLLMRDKPAAFVAALLVADMQRDAHQWRGEEMWSDSVGTLGGGLLPALEILAAHEPDEERVGDVLARNVPIAIVAVGGADPFGAAATVARLLDGGTERTVKVALVAAGTLPAPESADRIWHIHVEREREFDAAPNHPGGQDERSFLYHRRELSWAALRRAAAGRTDWLDHRIRETEDAIGLGQLLWLLIDADVVGREQAREMWCRQKGHLAEHLPADAASMIEAIRDLGGEDDRDWLANVPLAERDWSADRVLRSRARVDPEAAFEQIARRDDDYGWRASEWWMADLARADPKRLATVIRANADKGDHPFTDVMLHYRSQPELVDADTLEWLLDQLTVELAAHNAVTENDPDAEIGRLRHGLDLLPSLVEPWQHERVVARAGTALERELLRFATGRAGRTSRLHDTEGHICERSLAMFGGDGYDDLVAAELARTDPFGREDGYRTAHWSASGRTAAALAGTVEYDDPNGNLTVLRMQALAIHARDDEIEAMLRAGAPVYTDAAEMRSSAGRPMASLHARVELLVATGDPAELDVAARLAGFLREAGEARALVPPFLDERTPAATRRTMIGTFDALHLYEPRLLSVAHSLLAGGPTAEAEFIAAYLASDGDGEARSAVVEWLRGTTPNQSASLGMGGTVASLLAHADCRPAALDLLRRARGAGHLIRHTGQLRALAEAGDEDPRDELAAAAYRTPDGFRASTVGGIQFLRTVDPEEAFFASARLLARHDSPDAVALLLRIDHERALPVVFRSYRNGRPSLRLEIARRLRLELDHARLARALAELAMTEDVADNEMAVELAGFLPPRLACPWLDAALDADAPALREAAQESVRRRGLEAAAMAHVATMQDSPKPRQWALLQTIVECVDPDLLWSRHDPASLGPMLDALPFEFHAEAKRLVAKRRKEIEDEAKRADRRP